MARSRTESDAGPMTLGNAAAGRVRLIVWCRRCGHQGEPDLREQVARHGADLPVPEWAQRLVCSACGGRDTDFVVTGHGNRPDTTSPLTLPEGVVDRTSQHRGKTISIIGIKRKADRGDRR